MEMIKYVSTNDDLPKNKLISYILTEENLRESSKLEDKTLWNMLVAHDIKLSLKAFENDIEKQFISASTDPSVTSDNINQLRSAIKQLKEHGEELTKPKQDSISKGEGNKAIKLANNLSKLTNRFIACTINVSEKSDELKKFEKSLKQLCIKVTRIWENTAVGSHL